MRNGTLIPLLTLLTLSAFAEEPCRLSLHSLSKTSGAPGEIFEMHGEWGQRTETKIPSINKGNSNNLEVLSWSERVLEVRAPEDLASGVYRVGVYCITGGQTLSSGWKDYTIVPRSGGDSGSALRDKAQSYWMQRRVRESHEAYKEALEAYRRERNIAGQAFCHYGKAITFGSLGDENAAENAYEESALLYKQAMKSADAGGDHATLAKLEQEYSQVLYGLFRRAMRSRHYEEAKRVNEERLAIYARKNDIGGQAVCHQGLGEVAELTGRKEEAAEFYRLCAEEYLEARNPYGEKACREKAGGRPAGSSVKRIYGGPPPTQPAFPAVAVPQAAPYQPALVPVREALPDAEEAPPEDTPADKLKRTREGLSSLRSIINAYRMEQGRFPDTLGDLLVNKKYIEILPLLELPDHPRNRNFKLYPFYDQSSDKPSGLLDSGGWGYDAIAGTVFIDCLHKPAKGEAYHGW